MLNTIINKINCFDKTRIFIVNQIDGKTYNYHQLYNEAFLLAHVLKHLKKKEVIFLLENGIELFVLYFASMIANITVIPIDPLTGENNLLQILNYHKDAFVITDREYQLKHHICIKSSQLFPLKDNVNEDVNIFKNIDFEKVFLITYTSGSTGKPKGVKHSLSDLFYNAYLFGKRLNINEHHIFSHVMPMTYMAGILNSIVIPYVMGAKIIIFPRFSIKLAMGFWNKVKAYQINAFWLSPTMLHILLKVDKTHSIKSYFGQTTPLFCIGTAALLPELRHQFQEAYNVQLLQSYGLTETLIIATEDANHYHLKESVGTLLDYVQIDFVNNEIYQKVPWMFKGYTNADSSSYFMNGFFKTGDTGKYVNDNLFVTGRIKDLIIKGGLKISPSKIESFLMQQGTLEDCCVFPYIKHNEELICCCYVATADKQISESYLNKMIIEKLDLRYKVDLWLKLPEIPLNLNGKHDKGKLKKNINKYIEEAGKNEC